MGHLGPIRGEHEVLGHFLVQNALVFADFAYYDWEQQYLVPNGGQSAEKYFAGPKMGQFWPKLSPKMGFWQLSELWLIWYVQYCIFWLL